MKTEYILLFKFSISLFLIFIVLKILVPIFWNSLKKNKANQTSLDELIAIKTKTMRASLGLNKPQENIKEIKDSTLLTYEHSDLTNETQFLSNLFHSLKWGQAQSIKEISSIFQQNFYFNPSAACIHKGINCLFSKKLLISRSKLPDKNEIFEILSILIFFEEIKCETLPKRISQLNYAPLDTALIQISLFVHFLEYNHYNKFWKLSLEQNVLTKFIYEYQFNIKAVLDKYSDFKTMIQALKDHFNLALALTPIPYSKISTREESLELLGLSKNANETQIKKRYLDRIARIHPDKLTRFNIPDDKLKKINHHFQMIVDAYAILK